VLTTLPSIFITPATQPRKRARTLPRIALALATLATAGLFSAAHATYPGENGFIVFDTGAQRTINRVSPGSSTVTVLGDGVYPSVSPNGKKIAYMSGDALSLYVMNIDGSNPVLLDSGQQVFNPAWLPDGSQVVYGRLNPNSEIELWAVNPDGSGKALKRNLGPYTASIDPLFLAWSPSGNSYTFLGRQGLAIADDVNPAVNTLAKDGIGSSWAPDGGSILVSGWNGIQFEINPDGSNRRSVPPGDVPQSPSAISPDGKFIAGGVHDTNHVMRLVTRARAGTPTTFTWTAYGFTTDWSRVPKNCYTSTPQGGGGVLAGDVNYYASQCKGVVMPYGGSRFLEQVIAVGPDGLVYSRELTLDPFTRLPTWSSFTRVPGGSGSPLGIKAKKIAIAAAKDGSVQVVIVNADNNLVYHAMRYANGTWSGFNPLDGYAGAANFAARDVAITINASSLTSPGNAQVIANGLNEGNIFYRVRQADGNWWPFTNVPGLYDNQQISQALAISAAEDGYTDVVATLKDSTGAIHPMHQTRRPDSSWDGNWVAVGTPKGTTFSASSDVAVARTLSGTAQLLFTDSAGNVVYQERSDPNLPSSWQQQVTGMPIINTVGRAVSISAGATAGSTSQLLLTRTFPQ